ncbi:ATP-binding cassette domain-containing protein [Lactobacillus delbrueckii subsp. lactis]|uniref:ATP-binding cassette domain-containing protein n=1 Tax=Lactobacillus leichmannii TaxID=28039 RepID=A0ABT1XWF1_LACLE|nr:MULTISPECIES: ATP-binding cassette domain-containing protein [Lactobacillus]APG67788.1 spermidine/putrescine ABC transporter ATP-binding protein [Lactobacillus delbrueckii subsp. lactis]MCD5490761.1 ATP-binding cassette domain-containing protein [Lactobacillus delbrueckii subsp. lactis]MCD5496216.1 ATP-binding cassette domain-containing protein [Lactobacillus delbrueckii subsp. lactis]MCD5497885.1 ATP-binding cassette domain-containing protein [Lactobacillus delbrueckii subsp. lactis]MCD549
MALIELKQVSYRAGDQEILQDVSFAVEEGDYLTLTGPSGSGKSTTLKLIAGLISPNKGEIFYKGQNLDSLDLVQYRRQVSYCFQQPTLFDETVKANLALPFAIRKQDFAEKRAQEALKQVDLPADYLDKKITTLSGGEKQRVALIRNLLFRPELLLLDEVTTGLDEESKQIVHQLIARVHQEGTTIVQVTHDQEELAASKQLLHMEKGGVLK